MGMSGKKPRIEGMEGQPGKVKRWSVVLGQHSTGIWGNQLPASSGNVGKRLSKLLFTQLVLELLINYNWVYLLEKGGFCFKFVSIFVLIFGGLGDVSCNEMDSPYSWSHRLLKKPVCHLANRVNFVPFVFCICLIKPVCCSAVPGFPSFSGVPL